jgi:hypothetical protein
MQTIQFILSSVSGGVHYPDIYIHTYMKMIVAQDDLLIWAPPSFSVLDDSKARTRALLARDAQG